MVITCVAQKLRCLFISLAIAACKKCLTVCRENESIVLSKRYYRIQDLFIGRLDKVRVLITTSRGMNVVLALGFLTSQCMNSLGDI